MTVSVVLIQSHRGTVPFANGQFAMKAVAVIGGWLFWDVTSPLRWIGSTSFEPGLVTVTVNGV